MSICSISSFENDNGLHQECKPSITKSIEISSKYIALRKNIEIMEYDELS